MIRIGCALFLLIAGFGADLARAEEQLDWCAPIVVRPDTRFYTSNPCEPWWPDDEIARRADFVLDGFLNPSDSAIAPSRASCWGDQTMESSRAYHERLRAAAAGYGRTLRFIYLSRLDLVDFHTAATPGFDADYLVEAAESWRNVTDFFQRDTGPACACGCEWSDALGRSTLNDPPGGRMRDLIDAVSAPGTYQSKIFYSSAPSTGGSLAGAPRRFFGIAALADQSDAAYRAWRIGHMHDALVNGGYDAVQLNHKFAQYGPTAPPPYWGASNGPTVDDYLAINDSLWSSPAANYGYGEYLAGWAAFADDLEAASIPFSVATTPLIWRATNNYDDPATPDLDEAEVIRGVVRRARYVLLERVKQVGAAEYAAVVADIEGPGTATVVPMASSCGDGSPPGRTPAPLTASLTVLPDAAAVATFAGTSLRVRVGGTATGPWDAELWCQCTTSSCGTPDAITTGQTGQDWFPPLDVCDAAYGNVGAKSPRVDVHRAGLTATSRRSVTICATACANGRDDDRDGFADYPADPGCESPTDLDEISPALRCDDGLDNDGDRATDFPSDPQCTTPMQTAEAKKPCGLGAELLFPLAFLGLFRFGRGRRRRE